MPRRETGGALLFISFSSMYPYQLADDDIASVVDLIGACGESDDLVLRRYFDIGLEGGHGLDGLDIVQELLILIEGVGIGEGRRLSHKARDQVETVMIILGADIEAGVIGIIALIAVVSEACEH